MSKTKQVQKYNPEHARFVRLISTPFIDHRITFYHERLQDKGPLNWQSIVYPTAADAYLHSIYENAPRRPPVVVLPKGLELWNLRTNKNIETDYPLPQPTWFMVHPEMDLQTLIVFKQADRDMVLFHYQLLVETTVVSLGPTYTYKDLEWYLFSLDKEHFPIQQKGVLMPNNQVISSYLATHWTHPEDPQGWEEFLATPSSKSVEEVMLLQPKDKLLLLDKQTLRKNGDYLPAEELQLPCVRLPLGMFKIP